MEGSVLRGTDLPSVMALAYLGDAVFELYVREALVRRGLSKSKDLNAAALTYVAAPKQAMIAERLQPLLTEEEADVYRRAGNHHLKRPHGATGAEYRAATGLEAVLGMLHFLGRADRIHTLLSAGIE